MSAPFHVLEGNLVDVLEPFPPQHAHRVWGWNQSNGADLRATVGLVADDPDAYTSGVLDQIQSPGVRSFAVVDKADTRPDAPEAPVIGIIIADSRIGETGAALMHIAGRRKRAEHLLEASNMVIDRLFDTEPGIDRLRAGTPVTNKAAQYRAASVGFEPVVDIRQSVLRRSRWEERKAGPVVEEIAA